MLRGERTLEKGHVSLYTGPGVYGTPGDVAGSSLRVSSDIGFLFRGVFSPYVAWVRDDIWVSIELSTR